MERVVVRIDSGSLRFGAWVAIVVFVFLDIMGRGMAVF